MIKCCRSWTHMSSMLGFTAQHNSPHVTFSPRDAVITLNFKTWLPWKHNLLLPGETLVCESWNSGCGLGKTRKLMLNLPSPVQIPSQSLLNWREFNFFFLLAGLLNYTFDKICKLKMLIWFLFYWGVYCWGNCSFGSEALTCVLGRSGETKSHCLWKVIISD